MRAVLIPVKMFAELKKRLARHVSPEARAELAAALCEDFFRVVTQVRGVERVYVVSQEPRALDWAQHNGWETIIETEQVSESLSVDAASRHCASQGVGALLRIPIDLPLATPADIEAVLAAADEAPSTVLVPSRDGTGTNALLRSPPALYPSHFGPDSFALHLKEAERYGARVKILHNPQIELDIDEVEDLRALPDSLRGDSATARWFARHRMRGSPA